MSGLARFLLAKVAAGVLLAFLVFGREDIEVFRKVGGGETAGREFVKEFFDLFGKLGKSLFGDGKLCVVGNGSTGNKVLVSSVFGGAFLTGKCCLHNKYFLSVPLHTFIIEARF